MNRLAPRISLVLVSLLCGATAVAAQDTWGYEDFDRRADEARNGLIINLAAFACAIIVLMAMRRWVSRQGFDSAPDKPDGAVDSAVAVQGTAPARPPWNPGALRRTGILVMLIGLAIGLTSCDAPFSFRDGSMQVVFLAYVLTMAGNSLVSLSDRRKTSIDEANRNLGDTRPAILYLRSFKDENRLAERPYFFGVTDQALTMDDVIARPLRIYGPVRGLPNHENAFPAYSVASRVHPPAEWRSDVVRQVGIARAVAVLLGTSPGLRWELGLLVHSNQLNKTVLVFPPVSNEERMDRWNTFVEAENDLNGPVYTPDEQACLREWMAQQLHTAAVDVADSRELAVVVSFADRLTPRLHVQTEAGELGYDRALGEAIRTVLAIPLPHETSADPRPAEPQSADRVLSYRVDTQMQAGDQSCGQAHL